MEFETCARKPVTRTSLIINITFLLYCQMLGNIGLLNEANFLFRQSQFEVTSMENTSIIFYVNRKFFT